MRGFFRSMGEAERLPAIKAAVAYDVEQGLRMRITQRQSLSDTIAMTRLRAIEALDQLRDGAAVIHLQRMAKHEPIP